MSNHSKKFTRINPLDSWLMLNLSLRYSAIWCATKIVSLFVVTCIYMIVIAYHVSYVHVYGDSNNKLPMADYRIKNLIVQHLPLRSRSTIYENILLTNNNDSFQGSFSGLCEPTLSLRIVLVNKMLW